VLKPLAESAPASGRPAAAQDAGQGVAGVAASGQPRDAGLGLAAMAERSKALEDARTRAAAESLADLRRLSQELEGSGKRKLARTLNFLLDHVFEPGVNAAVASAAVGSTTNAISPRLEKETGRSLPAIIADVRGETAVAWMAADPGVTEETVAEMVGLSKYRLDRLLKKMGVDVHLRQGPGTPTFDPRSTESWQRGVRGELPPQRVGELVAHLRVCCPAAFQDAEPDAPEDAGHSPILVERDVAGQLWTLLSRLTYGAQREVVQLYAFASRAFFDLLLGKSREDGRRDRRRGVEIAELAVFSVEASATMLGEQAHEMKAEGLAWLGNARRLALDFSGADADLKEALRVIDTHKELQGSLMDGVAHFIFGNLRLFQQSYAEASSRFDYALTVFENHGNLDWQIRCRQHRAAVTVYVSGPAMAVSQFTDIRPLLVKINDEHHSFQVRYNLANCLSRAGRYEEAATELSHLRKTADLQAHPLWAWHVIWAEGNVDQGLRRLSDARQKYASASAGFEAAGAVLYAALVKLDMAILANETSETAEVIQVVASILPFFESLTLCTETVASLRVLGEALHQLGGDTELLTRLREALCKDPLMSLATERGRAGGPAPNPA